MYPKLIKALIILMAFGFLFTACTKNSTPTPPLPGNKISGKWRIDSLVSIFRDTSGNIRGTQLYPKQLGVDFYFQFNNDGTWGETVAFSSSTPSDLSENDGKYVLRSDTTFDMIYSNNQVLGCKIIKLTPTSFTFERSYPTLFNGTTPGIIDRIFTLKK